MPDPDDTLDEEQGAAATASDRAIAVLAGPGSGKTRTLSFRTRHLLANDPKAGALLLTFTNKAAAEMKARALGASGLSGKRIHASTFHTFCADVLRAHGALVGISPDFDILDSDETKALAQQAAHDASLADESRAWSTVRLTRGAPTKTVAAFGEAYEALKRSQGVADFDDLVVRVAALFQEHPAVVRAYAAKFRHILVDEFQDTNAVQFAVVDALTAQAASISIFADDDQAIFGFAGADSENIRRFAQKLGACEFPLTMNYRSRSEIVRLANSLIDADPRSSGRHMRAHAAGGLVAHHAFGTLEEEGVRLATDIAALVSSGARPSDIAVLVRNGYRADQIVAQLAGRGVPVSDWRGDSHEPTERRVLAVCLATVRGALSARQVTRLSELMGVEERAESTTAAFLSRHATHPIAKGLLEVRRLAFLGARPHEVATAAHRAVVETRPDLDAGLASIVEAVSHFELYDRDFTLEHLLAELALGSVGRSPTIGGGVKVATLHRTKGLQWKHVFLVGLEDGHLPFYKSKGPDKLPEERRLCFVGVSRAQESLAICRVRTNGRFSPAPSQFLEEMGLA